MDFKDIPSVETPLDAWPKLSEFDWIKDSSMIYGVEHNRWKVEEESKKVYGFVWPLALENLQLILKYSPLLEVGSGTGIVAKVLTKFGADVVATDAYPSFSWKTMKWNNKYPFDVGSYFRVKQIEAHKAVQKYHRNVLMCWPCYNKDWAFKAAQHITGHLIYIGENNGGCCADEDFFNLLYTEFELIEEQDKPQWYGLHDYISVYKRKVT